MTDAAKIHALELQLKAYKKDRKEMQLELSDLRTLVYAMTAAEIATVRARIAKDTES